MTQYTTNTEIVKTAMANIPECLSAVPKLVKNKKLAAKIPIVYHPRLSVKTLDVNKRYAGCEFRFTFRLLIRAAAMEGAATTKTQSTPAKEDLTSESIFRHKVECQTPWKRRVP